MDKQIDHINYPKSLKTKTIQQLRYIIKDASEAILANPIGHKSGYYADEICYASQELRNRGYRSPAHV